MESYGVTLSRGPDQTDIGEFGEEACGTSYFLQKLCPIPELLSVSMGHEATVIWGPLYIKESAGFSRSSSNSSCGGCRPAMNLQGSALDSSSAAPQMRHNVDTPHVELRQLGVMSETHIHESIAGGARSSEDKNELDWKACVASSSRS